MYDLFTFSWIGESWNPLRTNYQVRQVRERLAKGLVDRGILQAATSTWTHWIHPIRDTKIKKDLVDLVADYLGPNPPSKDSSPAVIALLGCAYAANVLQPALTKGTKLTGEQVFQSVRKAQALLHFYADSSGIQGKNGDNQQKWLFVHTAMRALVKLDIQT